MKKILIIINSVVYNRGSEALIRGISKICKDTNSNIEITLNSNENNFGDWINIENVDKYIEKNIIRKYMIKILNKLKLANIATWIMATGLKKYLEQANLVIVVGADNFDKSYNMQEKLLNLHTYIRKHTKGKLILYDCSFNESDITNTLLTDIDNFDIMTVRETISETSIKEKYNGKTKIVLYPDPAFTLEKEKTELPPIFEKEVVGINVSKLITNSSYGSNSSTIISAYKKMIDYILTNTDYNIALIPHVMNNADLSALRVLYSGYESNDRVFLIEDETLNAKQLKYVISNCALYIGARTHSTIAAYSTYVPTLVLGYSVKSIGIAKDIFGTYENYVLSVKDLKSDEYLVNGFKWLYENKDEIKRKLKLNMPEYIDNARKTSEIIKDI